MWEKGKHFLGYGLLVGVLLLAGRLWFNEYSTRIHTEARVSAEQILIKERDALQSKLNTEFDARIASLKVPEAKVIIQKVLVPTGQPSTPIPEVSKSELPKVTQDTLPGAPESKISLFTAPQVVELGKRELECQKHEGQLSTCQQDGLSKDKQITALQIEVKGGSTFKRLRKAGKCLAFAGLGAGLGSLSKNHALGAGVGAVMGGGTCQIFF